MMLSDQTLADRGCEQTTVSAMMAGFVVWLAGQRVPLPQRSRVYQEVERFLAWQHTQFPYDQFPYDVSAQRRAVWCYLLRRQRDGDSEAEVLKVWGALELLLTYVEGRSA
ncbi:MAG: hypothetical protein M3Z25_02800 [Actinomycetota bacterium]|nr:hypothetical protein [Actinomycetota bacterium]